MKLVVAQLTACFAIYKAAYKAAYRSMKFVDFYTCDRTRRGNVDVDRVAACPLGSTARLSLH